MYERSIALALEAGDEVSAMRSRTSLAILLHQQGQHEAALDLHREIERFYRRLGDRPMLARVINNEGTFLLALGRRDEAARAYEQAAQMHLEIGNLGDAAISLLNWVEILLDRGDAEQAQVRLQQAGELLGALPDSPSPLRQYYAALLERATAERAPWKRCRALRHFFAADVTGADGQLSRRTSDLTGTRRPPRAGPLARDWSAGRQRVRRRWRGWRRRSAA